ncbi:dihydrolipoamide acetyltransferase family protein [Arenimonas sp.]|jgi:2-oxoisovalerate dehydrogenase E2 component (dihydrolipoyl transacylase)|uniref:dihydrolipoamide acetyltransferase family protein n=1 Tax=Arenimonas sp. TaxID=1872635 RepID=UPI0037C1053A
MSTVKPFHLPDLGEGLPDAEIVEWHVKVGDVVGLDAPLVSMETAKAVVDVPSPFSGKVLALAGQPGDVILTGAVLVEIELDPNLPQRADAQDTGHHHGATAAHAHPSPPAPLPAGDGGEQSEPGEGADAGTVVGAMESSNAVRSEQAVAIGGVKAMPAVRALAKKLKVDLARVRATGAEGVITLADVKAAAANPSTQSAAPAPAAPVVSSERSAPPPAFMPPPAGDDKDEPIRGVRRNMLRTMSAAHAEVVPTTLMDDADLSAWAAGEDITVRTLRALAVAAKTEPAMNAWLNAKEGTLRRHSAVHIGVAIDSADGLFVASLKHCDSRDGKTLRAELNRLRDGVRDRSLPPEDLSGYTLMFSNFGVFAGKYATPVVVPPCVCIVGAGRLYHAVVPVLGGMETHRMMPISLTFDHRAATGGEAARFLKAMIDDLQRSR